VGTLDDCGVKHESTVHFVILGAPVPTSASKVMQVFIKEISKRTTAVDVEPELSILNLKNKIHDKLGFTPAQQKLVFGGKALTEGTLKSCNVAHESTIHLVLVSSAPNLYPDIDPVPVIVARPIMKIYVKTAAGKTLTIEIEPSDSIETFV
jgi:Ubiquitin family